jgi:Cys-rich repeat protein
MKKLLGLCVPTLVFSLFASACHIESHDEGVAGDSRDTCSSFCLHLYDCSSITGDQIASCLDTCSVKLHADSERTISACQCVMSDECRAVDAYDCPGAPLPSGTGNGTGGASSGSGGTTSSGGSASGGAATSGGMSSTGGGGASSAGGSAPLGCQGGYDCEPGEDCVGGACRQRCTASCQCPTDLSCIDHYCRSATPPPQCATDCECASGQHCISGTCG